MEAVFRVSLSNPDKEERAWMEAITEVGCIICYRMGYRGTPAAVHHITSGGRRKSHLDTIALCDPGHHKMSPTKRKISFHGDKLRFIEAHGNESDLLEYTKHIVELEAKLWKP